MDYEKLNKQATKRLYDIISDIANVELLEYNEGIRFKYNGHTYVFTSEVEE